MNKELAIVLRALGATQTAREVGKVDSSISRLTSRAGSFASSLKTNVGGAITHLGGRLKGLASAGLGVLGVGGLLSIGGALHEGMDEARAFGDEVIRLSKITGLTTETTSALASAMHHFGIDSETALKISSMAEKNLGNLTLTTAKAKTFAQNYGLALIDNKGHVKDFNALLLDSADFFNNKSIPAQKKAAALAKIYGRNWQALVPILSAGRKGIADAEEEAKRLGLTLTNDNIDALKKSKEATRNWSTALGGLKLQIGLALLPALTDLATAATGFVSTHRGDIVQFFKDLIAFGRNAASSIGAFAGQVAAAWNGIPPEMRDFLVKGLVADRTIKFLFGISPIQIVAKLAESALGGVGEQVAKSITGTLLGGVQKVWVMNPGFGGSGPGGPNLPSEEGGIKGALKTAAKIIIPLAALDFALQESKGPAAQAYHAMGGNGTKGFVGKPGVPTVQRVALSERQEAILASQARSMDALEANRLELVTKAQATTNAVNAAKINQVAAIRTGDSSIVAAIRGIKLQAFITVKTTGGYTRQSGTTLVRVGGNAARGATAGA